MADIDKTLKYYNKNAQSFASGTVSVKFTEVQDKFLEKLNPDAYILDFGCGSGRDTKYFLEHGYQVEAIDGSEELCKIASAYTGIPVRQMYFQDLDVREQYDGIWACSSLLHLSYGELDEVLYRIEKALKPQGILYMSFKHGVFEGERNGRYFLDLTEEKLEQLLKKHTSLQQLRNFLTEDVRPDREERWLNLFLKKINS